jgi:anti-anti-sigma regulatory factor
MKITEEALENRVVLRISGEMSLETAPQLLSRLLALGPGAPVSLDLAGVEAIDLACIQLLIAAQRSWSQRGAGLEIADSGAGIWAASAAAAGLVAQTGEAND